MRSRVWRRVAISRHLSSIATLARLVGCAAQNRSDPSHQAAGGFTCRSHESVSATPCSYAAPTEIVPQPHPPHLLPSRRGTAFLGMGVSKKPAAKPRCRVARPVPSDPIPSHRIPPCPSPFRPNPIPPNPSLLRLSPQPITSHLIAPRIIPPRPTRLIAIPLYRRLMGLDDVLPHRLAHRILPPALRVSVAKYRSGSDRQTVKRSNSFAASNSVSNSLLI